MKLAVEELPPAAAATIVNPTPTQSPSVAARAAACLD